MYVYFFTRDKYSGKEIEGRLYPFLTFPPWTVTINSEPINTKLSLQNTNKPMLVSMYISIYREYTRLRFLVLIIFYFSSVSIGWSRGIGLIPGSAPVECQNETWEAFE